ncbi:hypothetical protein [Helicobacter turcicus]|uniref:Uncharacterized protein n=1 Tax=Helicobacter turcicus TaxID=2867412 RepID=A0ABS7JNR9_9HELI|nr:hypothetical protein [Helicobacter turcicus]MBX7491010.1 hypothetical protein [Helicobacter turcicus]MBX7545863.1 hypothetical protein [Helicobacter turcicus]
MKETRIYKRLPLNGSENGRLDFAIIEEPYGEDSQAVVSICASIGDAQSWKIHLPLKQIKAIRKALKESKVAYKKLKKESKKAQKLAKVAAKKPKKSTKQNNEAKN